MEQPKVPKSTNESAKTQLLVLRFSDNDSETQVHLGIPSLAQRASFLLVNAIYL